MHFLTYVAYSSFRRSTRQYSSELRAARNQRERATARARAKEQADLTKRLAAITAAQPRFLTRPLPPPLTREEQLIAEDNARQECEHLNDNRDAAIEFLVEEARTADSDDLRSIFQFELKLLQAGSDYRVSRKFMAPGFDVITNPTTDVLFRAFYKPPPPTKTQC